MRTLFFVVILCFSFQIYAGTVSGRVVDAATGNPVAGITVGIDALYLLTQTSSDGTFSFDSEIDPGRYILHLSNGTYGHYTYRITVKTDFFFEVEIERALHTTNPLFNPYTLPLRQTRQQISYDDIQTYPMRGMGDSLHLLQTLPGVGGGYSLATVPIIRGTNPLLTKYYIDGIPVHNPYHYAGAFVPVLSAINEHAVDTAVLYKNDSPVWMGDSAGNTVDIRTKNPETPGISGKVIMDPAAPLIPTVVVNGVPDPDWAVNAVVRRSTTDPLLDLKDNAYSFGDYYTKVSYTHNRDHRLSLMFAGSFDDLEHEDTTSESGYDVEALFWEWYMRRTFFLETRLSRYGQKRHLKNSADDAAEIMFDPVEYRLFQSINAAYNNILLKGGYEYTYYTNGGRSNVEMDSVVGTDLLDAEAEFPEMHYDIEGHGIAVFADVMLEYGRVWGNAGIRYEYYGVEETQHPGYNAEIGYNITDELAVYGKAGRYITHPDMIYYISAVDQHASEDGGTTTEQSSLKDTITDSYALGMKSWLPQGLMLQAEAFYTRFDNLYPGGTIVTVNDDEYRKLFQLHKFACEDDGYNYGLELYLKGTYNGIYSGWISYSFQKTVRNTTDNEMTELLTGSQDVSEMDSEYSQSHILRVLASARWGRWQPALIFHAYSSLPYTEVASVDEFPGGITRTNYKKENASRYTMHHRLDAKVNYHLQENMRIYAEAWNIYFNKNNIVADRENDASDEVADIPFFLWFGLEICF